MSKEGLTESFLPKKLVKTTSLIWLSLLLATGAAYSVNKTPVSPLTGFPGLDILLNASKEGRTVGNEDLLDASIIDTNSFFKRFGKDLNYLNITAAGDSQGPFSFQSIIFFDNKKLSTKNFGNLRFSKSSRYVIGIFLSTNFKDVILTESQQTALKKVLGKDYPSEINCTTDIRISLFNFSDTNKEALISQRTYLHKDSQYLGHFKIFSDANLVSGEIKNYWERSGKFTTEIPEEFSEILRICG